MAELNGQIQRRSCQDQVEILQLLDSGERSIGYKRNALIARARGKFVAFVDDDDWVSADYVDRIREAILRRPDIDCIGIRGLITFRGKHPCEFVHSVRYQDYFSENGSYFRPPYHLNPIRREIASKYTFADVRYSEDIDWALRIAKDRALEREESIDSVLYFYRSRRSWTYQCLLDRSEKVRHALGIRMANRLRPLNLLRALPRPPHARL